MMKDSLRGRRGDGPCNKQLRRVFRATLPGWGGSGSLQVLQRCHDHVFVVFFIYHVHIVSGTEAGIRLYSDEIVSITCSALTSQSWTTKAQAAVIISAIALKLGKIVNLKGLLFFS